MGNLLEKGCISSKEAEQLRGRLVFMQSQVFGNAGVSARRVLAKARPHLDSDMRERLGWLVRWLKQLVPRPLQLAWCGPPLLLFTDGAAEAVGVSIGGVLIDHRDSSVLYFGCYLPDTLINEWKAQGKEQVIAEAETLPLLIARRIWRRRLYRAKVISFIDNEGARASVVKGSSKSAGCSAILEAMELEDLALGLWDWPTRVPSYSNLADGPSRLDFCIVAGFPGSRRDDAELPITVLPRVLWRPESEE